MYARKTHVFGLAFGSTVRLLLLKWKCSHFRPNNLPTFVRFYFFRLWGRKKKTRNFVGKQIIIEQTTERLPPRRKKMEGKKTNEMPVIYGKWMSRHRAIQRERLLTHDAKALKKRDEETAVVEFQQCYWACLSLTNEPYSQFNHRPNARHTFRILSNTRQTTMTNRTTFWN